MSDRVQVSFLCWQFSSWRVHCCAASEAAVRISQKKNLDSLDCIRLQLDHNASRACNHNALRHLTPWWHVLHEFFRARKKPLILNLIVSGNGILGNYLPKFGCKSAAIPICWYTGLTHVQVFSVHNTRIFWNDNKARDDSTRPCLGSFLPPFSINNTFFYIRRCLGSSVSRSRGTTTPVPPPSSSRLSLFISG